MSRQSSSARKHLDVLEAEITEPKSVSKWELEREQFELVRDRLHWDFEVAVADEVKERSSFLQMGLLFLALMIAACSQIFESKKIEEIKSANAVESSDLIKQAQSLIEQATALDRRLASEGLRPELQKAAQ